MTIAGTSLQSWCIVCLSAFCFLHASLSLRIHCRWAGFPGCASGVWFWAKQVKVQSDITVGGHVLPQDSSHFIWFNFWGSKSSVLWPTGYKFESSLYLFTVPTSLDWLIEFQGVLYLGLQFWYKGHSSGPMKRHTDCYWRVSSVEPSMCPA